MVAKQIRKFDDRIAVLELEKQEQDKLSQKDLEAILDSADKDVVLDDADEARHPVVDAPLGQVVLQPHQVAEQLEVRVERVVVHRVDAVERRHHRRVRRRSTPLP